MNKKTGAGRIALRFTLRNTSRLGKLVEVAHFYSPGGGKLFHARCERGVITSFLERINGSVKRSRSGRMLYLEGPGAEDALRKLIILAGTRQCMRDASRIRDLAEVVASLGEFESIFWYSKILEEYERRGFWGVCRIAKAFRVIYGIS